MSNRILISQQRTRVKSVSVVGATSSGSGTTKLEELTDVDVTNKSNNDVLVYSASDEKYIVKQIPVIDGGTF